MKSRISLAERFNLASCKIMSKYASTYSTKHNCTNSVHWERCTISLVHKRRPLNIMQHALDILFIQPKMSAKITWRHANDIQDRSLITYQTYLYCIYDVLRARGEDFASRYEGSTLADIFYSLFIVFKAKWDFVQPSDWTDEIMQFEYWCTLEAAGGFVWATHDIIYESIRESWVVTLVRSLWLTMTTTRVPLG